MKKCRKLVFALSSALATSQSLAVDVVAGTNTETVSQIVVMETTGGAQSAVPLTFNVPATTIKVRDAAVLQSLIIGLNGGTTLGTFDRYTADVSNFTAILGPGTSSAAPGSNFLAPGLISVLGMGSSVDLPADGVPTAAFDSALGAVHSNGDLVNYIRVDGDANSATWNVQFDDTTGFDSTDFLIVEERDGNTTFSLTALDLSGDVIGGAEVLDFNNLSYQWDTGYIADGDPFVTQSQVLSVIDLSLFNTTEAIGGFFVNDTGNADIKLFIGTAVPEPTSTGLIALSGLALLLRRRR